jgi:PAS domain S-box-containing protein
VRRTPSAYAISLLVLAAAVLLRWLLDPVMGDSLPLVTLFGGVVAAVWFGGYQPAVAVAILGYAACAYLFIPPRGAVDLSTPETLVGLVAYLFTCALIIGIGGAMRSAQSRANTRGELLRVTLGSIGDAVISTDIAGRVTYLNRVAESLTGWTQDEAHGQPLESVFRIINEDTRQAVESPATRALREGVVVGLANHTLLVARNGAEMPIDDSAAPIRDERGVVSGCVLIFRDVSERRLWEKREAARLQSAQLLASIVESSDDAIVSKSLDGIIQTWNVAAERLFGYTSSEAIGRHISLIIPPDRIAEEDHIITTLRAGTRIDHFETVRLRKNGQRIPVSLTVSPIKNEEGHVIGASKIARDISERKLAESERQKLVRLVENSTDFIGISDLNAVPTFVNRAGLQMVGLENLDEARAINVRDFFFPEDQSRMMNEFFPSVEATGHGDIEVRFRHFKTGQARWMAYKALRLDDESGHTVAYATVSQDVTERRRMEHHLRQLATDLAEADRRKDEFLATLAHELRNPLAPLSNTLEILKRSPSPDKTARRGLETMERQLEQLVRLVDDLMDLSRITHNRIELRKRDVELAPLVHQAVLAAQPLADASHHTIDVSLPADAIYLHADPVRLTQVFGNLLNNSCKYTSPGGVIRVTAQRNADDVIVTVTDTGIGIPADKLDSIFDMFAQVDRSLEQSQGGLGIGLTLVKRLVEMHGGSVEARSEGEGRGSAFVVRLPALAESAAVSATLPVSDTRAGATTYRILVVDDNEDSADSLALLLELTGHDVFTAHDGQEAFAAAEQHRPDVALLDIGLPVLNGHDVCRRIRQQPWGQTMVLVALTGWGQEEDRRRSQEAGFDGHLVKPVDHTRLMTLLASLTEPRTAR